MAFLLAVMASALILWLIAKNKNKDRGKKQTRNHDALTTNGSTIGYTKSNLTNESKIREELDLANKAVGGLTNIQRAWCETFMRYKQVMEESFAITEKTKDEITRSSRLEVARNNLERLESLSQRADCPLELHNSEEIWAEYYRLSGRKSPSTWGEEKPVDLSYFIGRPWGEIVAEMTGGANLVDGKQTWELAEEHKHDLPKMLQCCQAELRTMEQAGQVPAPFYFERAAILLRKAKKYESEVKLIELYLAAVDAWNSVNGQARPMGGGARHEKILQRYEKAKQLATKANRLKDG